MRHFLDFEKPIAELEGKIEELRHLTNGSDLNIADEVTRLEAKVDRQLRQTYARLTAWQKVQVARHPERPHASDFIKGLITDFTPLAGNRVLMLEHAVYSVISPEGCASILWRSAEKAQDAAEALKLTAQDLQRLGVIDEVIPEPLGGAHRDPASAIAALGASIEAALRPLLRPEGTKLREH